MKKKREMSSLHEFEAWKSHVNRLFQQGKLTEKIPSVVKRCPKCQNLSLEFDPDRMRIHCTKCGFEQHLSQ